MRSLLCQRHCIYDMVINNLLQTVRWSSGHHVIWCPWNICWTNKSSERHLTPVVCELLSLLTIIGLNLNRYIRGTTFSNPRLHRCTYVCIEVHIHTYIHTYIHSFILIFLYIFKHLNRLKVLKPIYLYIYMYVYMIIFIVDVSWKYLCRCISQINTSAVTQSEEYRCTSNKCFTYTSQMFLYEVFTIAYTTCPHCDN